MADLNRASDLPAASDRISIARANQLTGRDRKTLMKDIREGRFPNAVQAVGGRRAWSLLVQDLLDVDLLRPDQVAPRRDSQTARPAVLAEQLRIVELEVRLETQDALVHELRGAVERLQQLTMTLAVARCARPDQRLDPDGHGPGSPR